MINERINYLENTISVITPVWPWLVIEIQEQIDDKVLRLISENNEQTRGAIKCLRDLLNLPATLQSERDQIIAALSDEDAAA